MNKQEFKEWIKVQESRYKYMLLSRMKMDCEYFLNYGQRMEKNLWANSTEEQIAFMKIIYNLLIEKPE